MNKIDIFFKIMLVIVIGVMIYLAFHLISFCRCEGAELPKTKVIATFTINGRLYSSTVYINTFPHTGQVYVNELSPGLRVPDTGIRNRRGYTPPLFSFPGEDTAPGFLGDFMKGWFTWGN
jgi:hypothetical protein